MFGPLFEISWSTRGPAWRLASPLRGVETSPFVSQQQQRQQQQDRETAVAAVAAAVTGSNLYVKSEFIIATTFTTWRCFVPSRKGFLMSHEISELNCELIKLSTRWWNVQNSNHKCINTSNMIYVYICMWIRICVCLCLLIRFEQIFSMFRELRFKHLVFVFLF